MSIANYRAPSAVNPQVVTLNGAQDATPTLVQLLYCHIIYPANANRPFTLPSVAANTLGLNTGDSFTFTLSVTVAASAVAMAASGDGSFALATQAADTFELMGASRSFRAIVTQKYIPAIPGGAPATPGAMVLYPM